MRHEWDEADDQKHWWEHASVVGLAALVILLGVYPSLIMDMLDPAIGVVSARVGRVSELDIVGPQLAILLAAGAVLVWDALLPNRRAALPYLALAGILGAAIWTTTWVIRGDFQTAFDGTSAIDPVRGVLPVRVRGDHGDRGHRLD